MLEHTAAAPAGAPRFDHRGNRRPRLGDFQKAWNRACIAIGYRGPDPAYPDPEKAKATRTARPPLPGNAEKKTHRAERHPVQRRLLLGGAQWDLPARHRGHGVREHGGDVRGLHELRRHVHERDLRAVG